LIAAIMIAAALLCAAMSGTAIALSAPSAGDEGEQVLATSRTSIGAIRLGPAPTEISLGDDALAKVAQWTGRAGASQRLYLVLDEVRARQQPGILFEVYVDATKGGAPHLDAAHLVGHISLFELRYPLLSFDVTERLKALVAREGPGGKLVVTIKPSTGGADLSARRELRLELEQADVTIDRVRLVAQ